MFKTLTKTFALVAMIAIAFATASSAFASTGWNDSSQGADCPTVMVARNGNSPTTGYGCWFTSDTASVGDTVTFAVYYHNTGSASAQNVSVYLDNPGTNAQTAFTLNGGIKVNGQTVSTGSATISLDSSATLVPVRAQNEYNGGANPQSISTSQILGSGYTVGTIGTGWSQQGVAKISFKVTASGNNNQNGQAPSVYTNIPSGLDSLNGNVTLQGTVNSNGSATTVSFRYRQNGGSWITTSTQNVGIVTGQNFSQYVSGLSAGTYTYEAIATNTYGTSYGADQTFTINSSNTQSCGSGYYGTWPNCYPINNPVCGSGYYGTYPNCYPINNNNYCQAGYQGTWPNCYPIQNNNTLPSISTLGTVSVGGTVAVVDGYYSSNSCAVNTYFNYGTTQSLGQSTSSISRGVGSGSMASVLPNLNPNTTYYYQAVGNNCVGTSTGTIRSFTTTGVTTNDNTITHYVYTNTSSNNSTTVVAGGSSFIKLTIDNHRDVVREGKAIDYDVTWTNLTNSVLHNLVLEVNFPNQMVITDTDRGAIEAHKSSVVYQISSLNAHESGSMTISGEIDAGLSDGDPVVAQAVMAFENPKTSATENAIAYDADTFSVVSVAGASIFGLGFLPNSLIGWLIIILILILIILIIRHFWHRPAQNVVVHNQTPVAPVVTEAGAPTGDYVVYRPTPKQ